MSASKLNSTDIFQSTSVPLTTSLKLAASSVRIRKNGIEFPTRRPIAAWTEMTVEIESPLEAKKVRCTGVVVACNGNRHSGYMVALVFTNLSRQAQARLNSLAFASLR
jgi:PilZ domain-containing protein